MTDQILISMAATIAFAVLFHVPRSEYLLCGINGAVGWMVYLFCISKGTGTVLASIWAALVLLEMSEYWVCQDLANMKKR